MSQWKDSPRIRVAQYIMSIVLMFLMLSDMTNDNMFHGFTTQARHRYGPVIGGVRF